ncbi:MAG: hypothetical protein V7K77_00375 [Nostoc sp.]
MPVPVPTQPRCDHHTVLDEYEDGGKPQKFAQDIETIILSDRYM